MISKHISGKQGEFRIIKLEWYGGPDGADYTIIRDISDEEAFVFQQTGEYTHLYGKTITLEDKKLQTYLTLKHSSK